MLLPTICWRYARYADAALRYGAIWRDIYAIYAAPAARCLMLLAAAAYYYDVALPWI